MRRKPYPGWLVVLFDLLLIGAALNVFALFHHVLPQSGGGVKQSIVFGDETPRPSASPEAGQPLSEASPGAADGAAPTPEATPVPAVGDFSAVFPSFDTSEGKNALYSHQSDRLRICLTQGQTDDTVYFVADVWIRDIRQFQTAFATGEFERGSAKYRMPLEIATANNALLALTGDYCSARGTGVVIRNGNLYRESVSEDVCILYADGVLESYYRDAFDLDAAIARGAYQSWSFGPKLLDNGQRPQSYDGAEETLSSVLASHAPRAAIGYYEPGHYCLVEVDGRQTPYSRGFSITQLTDLFLQLGCVDAYNLDGGQTSAMIYDGAVITKPYKDGRIISDIIYFEGDAQ